MYAHADGRLNLNADTILDCAGPGLILLLIWLVLIWLVVRSRRRLDQ